MNLRNIAVVYRKEARDLLRDRRTLRSIILLPLVIMPLSIQGLSRVAKAVNAKAKASVAQVQVIGGADSPDALAWLQRDPKLRIMPATDNWRDLIANKKLQAAIEIPDQFDSDLKTGAAGPVTIYDYDGELKSGIAANQLEADIRKLSEGALRKRLAEQGLPLSFVQPVATRRQNVASIEKVAGNRIGGIVPYFIVILSLIGAIHPAIDATAGEKERGTLETLLCTPLARTEIVLGKFFMVLTSSLASVVMACISLVVSFEWLALKTPGGLTDLGLSQVNPAGAAGVLLLVLPLATLFSAVLFSIGLYSRSHREATTYMQPLMFLAILPAGIGMLPGIELNARVALIPILNVSLACREMLSGLWHWHYLALIFVSMSLYAAAALSVAVRMFHRESVVFRT